MREKNKTLKKLGSGIFMIAVLVVCLCISTFALIYATVTVDNNLFQTGSVKINLNDGKPVIDEREYLFEPGMTVEKTFFLENQSTWDVYYKIYFENVDGGLAEVLLVDILDGDRVLYSGKMTELTRQNVLAADDILRLQEKKEFTLRFYFPKEAGNEAQNLFLSFDIKADAVQTKNNPEKLFD